MPSTDAPEDAAAGAKNILPMFVDVVSVAVGTPRGVRGATPASTRGVVTATKRRSRSDHCCKGIRSAQKPSPRTIHSLKLRLDYLGFLLLRTGRAWARPIATSPVAFTMFTAPRVSGKGESIPHGVNASSGPSHLPRAGVHLWASASPQTHFGVTKENREPNRERVIRRYS